MPAENNVTEFPSTGLATTNAEVAAELRRVAARIEAGEFGEVSNTVTVISAGSQFGCVSAGRPIDLKGVLGLLTMATHRACWKEGAYQAQCGMW